MFAAWPIAALSGGPCWLHQSMSKCSKGSYCGTPTAGLPSDRLLLLQSRRTRPMNSHVDEATGLLLASLFQLQIREGTCVVPTAQVVATS